MASITSHLDWLRYTVKWDDGKNELENVRRALYKSNLSEPTGEEIKPARGYDSGLALKVGRVFWHRSRHEQGVSVELTGSDLSDLRKAGHSEQETLEWIASVDGRISTMHACMNLHDMGADVGLLIVAHTAGNYKSRARKVGVFSSRAKVNGKWQAGDTLYVGSSKSPQQLRIYNKAAERGEDGDWTRIEFVWRGRHAQAAHCAMLGNGILATLRGAVAKQIEFDLPFWSEAMTGETVSPYELPRKPSNRYKWLRDSVLPALKSELAEERERGASELYLLYYDALHNSRPFEQS